MLKVLVLCLAASGNFRVPETLILDSCNITSAGLKEDLTRLCSQVTELDLTHNLIHGWDEVSLQQIDTGLQ